MEYKPKVLAELIEYLEKDHGQYYLPNSIRRDASIKDPVKRQKRLDSLMRQRKDIALVYSILDKFGLDKFRIWRQSVVYWLGDSRDHLGKSMGRYSEIWRMIAGEPVYPKYFFRGLSYLEKVPSPDMNILYSDKHSKFTSWSAKIGGASDFCHEGVGSQGVMLAASGEDVKASATPVFWPLNKPNKFQKDFVKDMLNFPIYMLEIEQEWVLSIDKPLQVSGIRYCQDWKLPPKTKARADALKRPVSTLKEEEKGSSGFKRVNTSGETFVITEPEDKDLKECFDKRNNKLYNRLLKGSK